MAFTDKLSHAAERKAFETILDNLIKKGQTQDAAQVATDLVNMVEKLHSDVWSENSFQTLRMIANDPDGKWAHYAQRQYPRKIVPGVPAAAAVQALSQGAAVQRKPPAPVSDARKPGAASQNGRRIRRAFDRPGSAGKRGAPVRKVQGICRVLAAHGRVSLAEGPSGTGVIHTNLLIISLFLTKNPRCLQGCS